MHVVHETPGRLRLRCPSRHDMRLDADFVEALPRSLAGVRHARANPSARSLVIRYDGTPGTRAALLRAVTQAAGTVRPRRPGPRKAATSLGATVVSAGTLLAGALLPPALRSMATWGIAAPTMVKGLRALVAKGVSVEALDATALAIALARRDFGTAAATLTLLNIGDYLEATTREASDDLLRRLLAKPPSHAWRESADGSLQEVAADQLRQEDVVVVGPGEMIPVDGQVVSGAATINLSSITGESVPIDREAGGRVLAGGVVEQGRLRIRSVRVGDATTTARITAFIRSALDRPARIQSNAERLARQRVLITLALGAVTFALTRDVSRLASIFLVDYSCALKLGVPVAMKSALYRGARAGILVKGGRTIEDLAAIDTVVFDKTGTVTFGELSVADIVPVDDRRSGDELLALLASLEEHATHPVADAIVREARRNALEHIHHDEVDFIVAHGLISEVRGKRIVVGSRHFLEEHETVPFAAFEDDSRRLTGEGKLLLYAAIDGKPAGIVALRDRLRPEAASAIRRLRQQGVGTIMMMTGDHQPASRAVAGDLDFDSVFADCQPEEKAEIIRDLQRAGRRVAFVGDGVNDAPALIAADVGIAMPRGSDLTRATADVVLLRDRLSDVARSLALAGDTIRLIESNFRWAVTLNSVLFLAAVTGRAPPVFSSVAHNSVTIGTLLRALAGPQPAAATRGGDDIQNDSQYNAGR